MQIIQIVLAVKKNFLLVRISVKMQKKLHCQLGHIHVQHSLNYSLSQKPLTLPDDDIVEADGVPEDCALNVARLVFDCIAAVSGNQRTTNNRTFTLDRICIKLTKKTTNTQEAKFS